MKVKMRRVEAGDIDTMVLGVSGYVCGEIPCDGFIIVPDSPGAVPVFVRNSDLEKMKQQKKGHNFFIESWGEMKKQNQTERVVCPECGSEEFFPIGSLTEQGKREFRCHVCRQAVLERRIEEKNRGNKKLLID